ncbi:hypothetical protein [Amycolatopsis sp. NPDC059657]|uniref:hypothetical protein n=1 Tax=Amycolatopsis sp. NPDC059657 TaxID=3346899 RepID=UPI0036728197
MKSTITVKEANQRVDDLMEQGRKALGPDTRLTDDFRKESMACDDPTDQGPKGRVFATRDAQVVNTRTSVPQENFAALREWWKVSGFQITSDASSRLFAENPANGFRMSIETNAQGLLYLGVSSPCVWPNGTPEPKEK